MLLSTTPKSSHKYTAPYCIYCILSAHVFIWQQVLLCNIDIDECTQGTSGCSQGCRNTDGSFICTCNEGYQTHHDDPTFCVGMTD